MSEAIPYRQREAVRVAFENWVADFYGTRFSIGGSEPIAYYFWERGVSVPEVPSPAESELLAAYGLSATPDPEAGDGSWYVWNPDFDAENPVPGHLIMS